MTHQTLQHIKISAFIALAFAVVTVIALIVSNYSHVNTLEFWKSNSYYIGSITSLAFLSAMARSYNCRYTCNTSTVVPVETTFAPNVSTINELNESVIQRSNKEEI